MKKEASPLLSPSRRQVMRFSLGACAASALTGLTGCGFWPDYSFNYVLKIAVVVDGIRHVGASVLQIEWYLAGMFAHFDGIGFATASSYGEAVTLDLGVKGLLFGLVKPPVSIRGFNASGVTGILSPYLSREDNRAEEAVKSGQIFRDCAQVLQHETAVPGEYWPALIRFKEFNNPKSAELVKPDMFEDIYGLGAAIQSVTMQITDKPVSHTIERYIPWLKDTTGAFSHETGPATQVSTAALITRRNFQRNGEP